MITDNVKHLHHIGCTNVDEWSNIISFDYNGYSYSVDGGLIDTTMTIGEIIKEADAVSCCGDLISYGDELVCPTCKENL